MSNIISTFKFQSNPIRIELINNEPHFALKDVCEALSIKVASPDRFRLNAEGVTRNVIPTRSGDQELTFINEPNLYRIIFRSNKAEAVEFQNWVFEEVLPQIRKTGSYTKSTTDERTGLRQAVSALVGKRSLNYSDAYSMIHQRFNIEHIDELTPEQIPMAVEYVHKIYLEGELIINEPKKAEDNISISADTFKAIMQHARLAKSLAEKTETFHRDLFKMLGMDRYVRNDIAAISYDVAHEFNSWLRQGEEAIAQHERKLIAM